MHKNQNRENGQDRTPGESSVVCSRERIGEQGKNGPVFMHATVGPGDDARTLLPCFLFHSPETSVSACPLFASDDGKAAPSSLGRPLPEGRVMGRSTKPTYVSLLRFASIDKFLERISMH